MRIDSIAVQQARNTDIIAFLKKYCGFAFDFRGGTYRCKQHPSLAVKSDHLSWYWHSKGIGGYGVLDYLIRVEKMLFRDAVEAVAGFCQPIQSQKRIVLSKSLSLILPEKAGLPQNRLYNYLCHKRGIDGEIIKTLIQEGKLYEDKRGNVVFIGFDEQNKPRFASLRGTYGDCRFRMDCSGSDKRYSFNMTYSQSERLYIFESPIDAMSHASLENALTGDINAWKVHNRLSLAGTSDTALIKFCEMHTYTKELVFCLDNDPAGREAAVSMVRKYTDKGFYARIELPDEKDCNEDLLKFRAVQKYKSIDGLCI